MKRCEMGKTYIKLNDERESYEEIQKFFEEWGLEKVSEESLGDDRWQDPYPVTVAVVVVRPEE